jgi:hypothetical protein
MFYRCLVPPGPYTFIGRQVYRCFVPPGPYTFMRPQRLTTCNYNVLKIIGGFNLGLTNDEMLSRPCRDLEDLFLQCSTVVWSLRDRRPLSDVKSTVVSSLRDRIPLSDPQRLTTCNYNVLKSSEDSTWVITHDEMLFPACRWSTVVSSLRDRIPLCDANVLPPAIVD